VEKVATEDVLQDFICGEDKTYEARFDTLNYDTSSLPGAIIGDGDRNQLPFSVLALAPSKKTNVLFLEKIAPSSVTHARVCCEDSAQRKTNKMASEITFVGDE